MKKKAKIFLGMVALFAIVSMNMRHAWMNYGIVKAKIAAGVIADLPAPNDSTTNDTTKDTVVIYINRETIPVKYIVNCKVADTFYFYKYIKGRKTQIAKGERYLSTGELLIIPRGTDIIGAIVEEGTPIYDDFESMGQTCGQHKEGEACAPKSADLNCVNFIGASS